MSLKHMTKSLFSALIVTFMLSNSAHAVEECCEVISPCCSHYGSFYTSLGLGFGPISSKIHFANARFVPTSPIAVSTVNTNIKRDGYGTLFGSFALGYQTPSFCKFYLCLEAAVEYAPKHYIERNSQNAVFPVFGLNYRNWSSDDRFFTPAFTLSLKPGYQIYSDVSVFGKIGYGVSRGEIFTFGDQVGTVAAGGVSATLNTFLIKRQKYLNTCVYGMGFNIRTSDHFSLNLGYTVMNCQLLSKSIRTNDPATGQFLDRSFKLHPIGEAFTASISYAFTPEERICCDKEACVGGEIYGGVIADRDNCFHTQFQHQDNFSPNNPFEGLSYTNEVSRGWGYEAFAGYGYTFPCAAYLGVEGFYNPTRAHFKQLTLTMTPPNVVAVTAGTSSTSTFERKFKDSYGVSLIPGYKLNDHVLLYVKLGYVNRRFEYKNTFSSVPPTELRAFIEFNERRSKTIRGYLLGGGFDLKLCNNLYLRNEYAVTFYRHVHFPRNTTPLLRPPGTFLMALDRAFNGVTTGEYKLGVVYKFPI